MLKLKPTKDTKANAYFAALDKAGQMMTLAGMYAEVSTAGAGRCGGVRGSVGPAGELVGVGGCWWGLLSRRRAGGSWTLHGRG